VTLPFWQELLPEMVYVLCIRHPIHSARSLHARNGVSPVEGVHSWLVYVRSALQQTQGGRRLAVAYEDTIDDCLGTLAQLAAFIGQPQRADWRDVKEAATTFVDPDLYHQRSDVAAETESDLPPKAVSQLNRAYEVLREQGGLSGALPLLDTALATVQPEVKRHREQEASNWQHEIRLLSHEVGRVCQGEATTILVGQHELGDTPIPECRTIPFLERDGQYWGPPADDEIAIQELERLRRTGAAFIVFAWSAFWWLDYYAAFHRYLRSRYPCRLENDRLVAFDLGVA
jgi:hypothetical protein